MTSEKVGVWRRGGHGSRGRGFPERDRGENENRGFSREVEKSRGRGISGNEGERRNRGNPCEVEKRGKIVWGAELESERGHNGGKIHELENSEARLVGRCTEFCPLEEKRMRTKERLLHRKRNLFLELIMVSVKKTKLIIFLEY